MTGRDAAAEQARQLADELRDALDDPKRDEWGGYPWEHLGDAERDVRVLLNYVTGLEVENGRLRAGMERIIEMGDYVYKPHEFAEVARAALAQDTEQENA